MKVGLLHGRQSPEEKQAASSKFRVGETPVMVSTPVVEVGVDVPEATVMLVENAERFGLAQLHQLRGRIGRLGPEGVVHSAPRRRVTPEAEDRLNVLLETDDGFVIAQKDLELRGSGEVFGTRQSGEFELRYANPVRDEALLMAARGRRAIDRVRSESFACQTPRPPARPFRAETCSQVRLSCRRLKTQLGIVFKSRHIQAAWEQHSSLNGLIL